MPQGAAEYALGVELGGRSDRQSIIRTDGALAPLARQAPHRPFGRNVGRAPLRSLPGCGDRSNNCLLERMGVVKQGHLLRKQPGMVLVLFPTDSHAYLSHYFCHCCRGQASF